MSDEILGTITAEELQQMVNRVAAESKSIYAPSGLPDPRLLALFKGVDSAERSVRMYSNDQVMIDVTFLLDLGPIGEATQETQSDMVRILLHDGHRRLAAHMISVEESGYHDDPDRLVYSCAKAQRSRIKKFVKAYRRAAIGFPGEKRR